MHLRVCANSIAQSDNGRMHAQLQDGIHLAPGFLFQLLQPLQIPGVEHQWLFTNRVCAIAQAETNMRVMQIIRRADADIMKALLPRPDDAIFLRVDQTVQIR